MWGCLVHPRQQTSSHVRAKGGLGQAGPPPATPGHEGPNAGAQAVRTPGQPAQDQQGGEGRGGVRDPHGPTQTARHTGMDTQRVRKGRHTHPAPTAIRPAPHTRNKNAPTDHANTTHPQTMHTHHAHAHTTHTRTQHPRTHHAHTAHARKHTAHTHHAHTYGLPSGSRPGPKGSNRAPGGTPKGAPPTPRPPPPVNMGLSSPTNRPPPPTPPGTPRATQVR